MPQVDGSIRIGTEITTKQAEKELKSLESSISKTADKIASLRSKMDALKDVKLPTDEYKAIQNQIDTTEKKLNDLLARQEKFLATGGKESSSAYQKMQYEIDELKASLPHLKSELQDLVDTGKAFTLGSDTEEYVQTAAQIEQLNQQMASDTQRQSELQSQLTAEEQRLADIKANAAVSDQQIVELLERREQLTKEIADMESAGLGYGYREYDSAQQELSSINNQMREYKDNLATIPESFSRMYKSAQRAFSALGSGISKSGGLLSLLKNSADKTFQTVSKGAKQSTGLISTFASRLRGLAASAFIFNLISKGFSSMVSSMKTGFTNLMGYSNSFANSIQSVKNSLSTLGNQIAAAFAPVVQAVIPWLNQLISVLSVAMSYISQFIAALTGKGTYIRAKKVQDSYGSSLGGTAKKEEEVADNADDMSDALDDSAKSAKKAHGALAAFDDLDVLEKQDESTDVAADKIKDLDNQLKDLGSGAGGGMGDLFEEVPIESSILDAVEKLKDILAQLFAPLKEAWEREGKFVMDSWKYALKEVWQLIKDIGRDFLTVWNQEKTIQMLANILHIIGDIGLIVGNIAHALDEAWNKNNTGLHILENIRDIFEVIIQNIREAADFTVEWSKTLDFSPLLESIEHLTRALVPFADFVSGTLADFYTQFILPLTSWVLSEEGFPRLVNILGDFMDAVDWDALREALKNLYTALEPYAEAIGEGLIDFIEKIKDIGVDILNSLPVPIQKLADALNSGDPERIRGWTTTILDFVAAATALKAAFSGFEIVEKGLTLLGFGGAAGSVAAAGTAMEGAATGGGLLSTALNGLKTAAGYAGTVLAGGLVTNLILTEDTLNEMGEAAGANEQQIAALTDRYSGLGVLINPLKDGFSLLANAMDGFGFNASNTANQIGTLEHVMNSISEGTIYTDSQLEKLQTRFGLTDEDIEMLRQSVLDTNEPLRQLADDFGLLDASAETLQQVHEGMKLVEEGTITATEAFDEFSKPMWGMNDSALAFFQTLSESGMTIDEYKASLENASEATQQFSNDMKEAGENISTGITEGFENVDVETPTKGFFARTVEALRSVFDMHSPAKNMEPFGENILLGVLEGFKNNFSAVQEVISELFRNIEISFTENIQNIQAFFSEAWTAIYESTVESWTLLQEFFAETWILIYESIVENWTLIQEYFTEFWMLFTESLIETWEEILLIFTEKFEQIQLLFKEFILFMNEIFLISWIESWTMAGEQYQTFHDLLTALTKAIQEMLTLFMNQVQTLINTIWKNSWKNAENTFTTFKGKVQEISDAVREIVQSLFEFVMGLVSEMLAAIESVGTAAASISAGGFSGGGGAAPAMSSYSTQNFSAFMDNIPHLASGSVLRGGNPFMAILNDQPRGQTNVEAPLNTIKQAVREELSGINLGNGNVNPVIALNVNGEEFARLTLNDILNEMGRQGYDVDVLGVI